MKSVQDLAKRSSSKTIMTTVLQNDDPKRQTTTKKFVSKESKDHKELCKSIYGGKETGEVVGEVY